MQSNFVQILIFVGMVLPFGALSSEFLQAKLHKVKKGETLFKIAQIHSIPLDAILEINPSKKKNPTVLLGELIKIPTTPSPKNLSTRAPKPASSLYGGANATTTAPSSGDIGFVFPLEKKIAVSQKFSSLTYEPNKGIFFQKTNRPVAVLATQTGRVVAIDYMDGYGNYIILQHYGGYFSVYGNMGKVLVREGQTLESGARLGLTENQAGLYFQITHREKPLDPLTLLRKG